MIFTLLRKIWAEARDDIIILAFVTIIFSIVFAVAYCGDGPQHFVRSSGWQ